MHIFPLPPGLSPKKKIGERGPEVADVLSNSSEMTDVSQSLLGVQLVWEQREKKGEIAARGCVSFTSPVPPVKLRHDQYLSKTLYN